MLSGVPTLCFLGADVGAAGAPFLPRGPFPSSARLLKLFELACGTSLRFTSDACLDLPEDKSESLRARSLACFDNLLPISSLLAFLSSAFGGGGGG